MPIEKELHVSRLEFSAKRGGRKLLPARGNCVLGSCSHTRKRVGMLSKCPGEVLR